MVSERRILNLTKIILDILPRRQRSLGKCSTCYEDLGEALKFRIYQLRNFGRQSNRLKTKSVTLGMKKIV